MSKVRGLDRLQWKDCPECGWKYESSVKWYCPRCWLFTHIEYHNIDLKTDIGTWVLDIVRIAIKKALDEDKKKNPSA